MIIKNSNLRSEIFSSRYKILGVIVAIVLILFIIRIFNEQAKKINEEAAIRLRNTLSDTPTYNPGQTVISGENVSEQEQERNNEIIDKFISYCNLRKSRAGI